MDQVADVVEKAFTEHFERTTDQPDGFESAMLSDSESNYEWSRRGQEAVYAIAEALEADETIAEDIRQILAERHYNHEHAQMGEENEFAKESYYEGKSADDVDFQIDWSWFENAVKTAERFFSRSAQTTLGRVFENVEDLKTESGRPAVVAAGPGSVFISLFRARSFQSDSSLREAISHPDVGIGPPPSKLAVAGRMNPAGISVFYGATDANTALSEIRPPVGSSVVVGQFDIIRPLRLLDIGALEEVYEKGSIFDPDYVRRIGRAKFLRSLSGRISRAVLPEDANAGYLVTQVIADYLANVAKLDGIIYRSVQSDKTAANIVLFHNASRVEPMELPKGTKLETRIGSYTDDDSDLEYTVLEMVEGTPSPSAQKSWDEIDPSVQVDLRLLSLKLKLASVEVHRVESVAFSTMVYPVSRRRLNNPH